jgi:hypothetical protein
MMQSSLEKSMNERKQELRKFGYVMGGFVALMFGLLLPWLWSAGWPRWPWIVAGIFFLMATVRPVALSLVYKYWMRVGEVLGWINTRIILGIVYILVFSPLGLLMRILGKDTLQKKWNGDLQTYRINKMPRKPEHMERQF